MRTNKGYTRINNFTGLAPLVMFLSSYLPLFVLIIIRQVWANVDYLSWGGFDIESLVCMIKYFGMSVLCFVLSIFGIIGTLFVFKNLNNRVKNGKVYKITELSSMNDEPLAYIATYIIPIMFENYSSFVDCITIVCVFFIVYRLYIRSKLILVNPILGLKYYIYNIRYEDDKVERQGFLIAKDDDLLENDHVQMYNVGYQLFYGCKR